MKKLEMYFRLLDWVGPGSIELKTQIDKDFNSINNLKNVRISFSTGDYPDGEFSVKYISDITTIKKYKFQLMDCVKESFKKSSL